MPSFSRQSYSQLSITLEASEALGILDTDYLEDYDGVDGRLTLRNVGTFQTSVLLIQKVPGAAGEVFRGWAALSSLPDGYYNIEGRCRDVAGNYTILTAFRKPVGNETVLPIGFQIVGGVVRPRLGPGVGVALSTVVGTTAQLIPTVGISVQLSPLTSAGVTIERDGIL